MQICSVGKVETVIANRLDSWEGYLCEKEVETSLLFFQRRRFAVYFFSVKQTILTLSLAALLLLTACGSLSSPAPLSSPLTPSAAPTIQASPAQTDSPTPAASPTPQSTLEPTPAPPPLVNLYNRYLGKDTQRQPELVITPPGTIVPISGVDGYSHSYVEIFLGGKQVNGEDIRGEQVMLVHLIQLFNAAYQDVQASVAVLSSYRSFEDQQYLQQTGGEENDDNYLAPPGRSEHQLGTAVDLAWNAERLNFYLMNVYPQARVFYNWLKENAHLYGFIFSYPFKSTPDQSTTNILVPYVTEYKAEPWHLRYVGLELAKKIFSARDDQGRDYLDPQSTLIPQQFMLPAPTP